MLRKGMGETYCKFILERIRDGLLRTKTSMHHISQRVK